MLYRNCITFQNVMEQSHQPLQLHVYNQYCTEIFDLLILMLESSAEGQRQPAVKNLEEVRQSVVQEFLSACRASRCVHCHSPARPIRQESHVKILHGRMPSSRVVKSMLMEKIKLVSFYFCCFPFSVCLAVCLCEFVFR